MRVEQDALRLLATAHCDVNIEKRLDNGQRLIAERFGANALPLRPTDGPPLGGWPSTDYETIWTVRLDAQGNVSIDNALCKGIDSAKPPETAPLF